MATFLQNWRVKNFKDSFRKEKGAVVHIEVKKTIEGIRSIKGKVGIRMKYNKGDKVDFVFSNLDGIYVKTGTVLMKKEGKFFRKTKYLIEAPFEHATIDSDGIVWVKEKESCTWVEESRIIGLSISKDR